MNKYLITAIVTTVLWHSLLSKAWGQAPNCIPLSLPQVSKSVNTVQQNNVIVIGKVPNRPYVVVIPGNSDQLLNVVRSYVSDAFLAKHRLGTYIYAGSSSKREEAECLSSVLKYHRIDARVIYFH
ncbi:MAG: hypothetical protein HEQ27_22065 [Dolichospermum sp. JUN01]|jgi:hypothetical protein|uniref:hypothetical protein n=1 Tax=Dolichospermum sp. UHCC 0352 TaxID=2590011 RepID=UPI0014460856|nr:hypothetical protein [Dolichospermum sp. UHCC 0352]MBO1059039.1 hypothetical protein [Dolichospermum sp. JUN01]MTJ21666.1 hypothetical protein [Dolichospermum sp. UHCC 0352]